MAGKKRVKRVKAKRVKRARSITKKAKLRIVTRERLYERAVERIARRLASTHGSMYVQVLGELLEGGDGEPGTIPQTCVDCGESVNKDGVCTARGCERKISRDVYKRVR